MHSDRTNDALAGIRLNVEAIADFTKGMTLEQFSTDQRTFYAVVRALEIISQASRRLPDELKARYPQIKWRSIHDAGNVYRHAYSKISKAEVWDTAVRQLDALAAIVNKELDGGEMPNAAVPCVNNIDESTKE